MTNESLAKLRHPEGYQDISFVMFPFRSDGGGYWVAVTFNALLSGTLVGLLVFFVGRVLRGRRGPTVDEP